MRHGGDDKAHRQVVVPVGFHFDLVEGIVYANKTKNKGYGSIYSYFVEVKLDLRSVTPRIDDR